MKKLLIFITLALLTMCFFTVVISAEENVPAVTDTYYLVQADNSDLATQLRAEGKKAVGADVLFAGSTQKGSSCEFLSAYADGSHIEIILAENIITDLAAYQGLLLNRKITVTVKYNGYYHYERSGNRENVFTLRHAEANLRLIGSQGLQSNKSEEVIVPSFSNGVVTNTPNADIRHGKVYAWAFDGNVYAENMRTTTGEEFVYSQDDDNTADSAINTYEFNSCICHSNGAAIGLEGQYAAKIIKTKDCIILGKATFWTIASGSYCYNTEFEKGISLNCWSISNQICTLEKCTIASLSTSSGRTHFVFIDCTFDPATLSLGGDGGGDQFLRVYTSPTCTEDGSLVLYRSTDRNSENPYEDEINNYSAPALGHEIDIENATGVVWENYFENGMYQGFCARCKADTNEQEGTAKPLFESKGLSHAEYQDTTKSMTQGFKVNTEMLVYLENGYDFGIVATVNKDGGEIAPALDGTGVVSASFVEAGYSIFHVKVTNIPEASKDTKIVFCAYLVNGGKTYYLNNGTTAETVVGLDYTTVSK